MSDWLDRVGPYDTAEEASRALDVAHARNEAWEAENRRWNDDPDRDE
ncbi:hypothetical protein [Ruania halotolerans]|nr:hypothetical protein [Ruania halotolerans]UFU04865.1 hypothetical protein LQF10_10235 [Ruania halotolerans]